MISDASDGHTVDNISEDIYKRGIRGYQQSKVVCKTRSGAKAESSAIISINSKLILKLAL